MGHEKYHFTVALYASHLDKGATDDWVAALFRANYGDLEDFPYPKPLYRSGLYVTGVRQIDDDGGPAGTYTISSPLGGCQEEVFLAVVELVRRYMEDLAVPYPIGFTYATHHIAEGVSTHGGGCVAIKAGLVSFVDAQETLVDELESLAGTSDCTE